jgi:hypothetical protein
MRSCFIIFLVLPLFLHAQHEGMAWHEGPLYKTRVATRLVNTHATEHLGKGEFDFRILHRFGPLNGGFKTMYGLDQAQMRLALDYGLSEHLSVGIGRSTLFKEYDAFVKCRLLRQGVENRYPISAVWVSGMFLNSLRWAVPDRDNLFSSRLAYAHQLLMSRRFGKRFMAQLTPGMVHRNLVATNQQDNDIWFLGLGGRMNLSQRFTLVADYQHRIAGNWEENRANPLTLGLDINTGGHVFQLHVSTARGMNERAHLTETEAGGTISGLRFGFNLSRVF